MKESPVPVWTRSVLAAKAGVGVETLRFYEEKCLLGKPRRNASGYRIYSSSDLERLQFISRSQALGFKLQEIGRLLQLMKTSGTPRKELRDFAEERLQVIRRKLRDLKAMERALGKLVTECDGQGSLRGCPIAEFLGGEDLTTTTPNEKSSHE